MQPLLGIQPKRIGYGLELSASVQARLPEVAGAAREMVARLQQSLAAHRRYRRDPEISIDSKRLRILSSGVPSVACSRIRPAQVEGAIQCPPIDNASTVACG